MSDANALNTKHNRKHPPKLPEALQQCCHKESGSCRAGGLLLQPCRTLILSFGLPRCVHCFLKIRPSQTGTPVPTSHVYCQGGAERMLPRPLVPGNRGILLQRPWQQQAFHLSMFTNTDFSHGREHEQLTEYVNEA